MRNIVQIFIIILSVSIILPFFVSCEPTEEFTQDTTYRAAIVDFSELFNTKEISIEYEIRDYDGFINKIGEENVDITVGDLKLKGSCLNLSGEFYRKNYYPVYVYEGENYQFWLNPDGKLEYYNWEITDTSVEKECSEEEIIQIAKKFVSNIVDVDMYSVSAVKLKNWKLYSVYFDKYVDGIKTTESLCVMVTLSGELDSYVADMLDQFQADTKNPFDMKKVEEAANVRVTETVEKVDKNSYDRIEYRNEEFKLTKLKNGELAILYTVEIVYVKTVGSLDEYSAGLLEILIMQ